MPGHLAVREALIGTDKAKLEAALHLAGLCVDTSPTDAMAAVLLAFTHLSVAANHRSDRSDEHGSIASVTPFFLEFIDDHESRVRIDAMCTHAVSALARAWVELQGSERDLDKWSDVNAAAYACLLCMNFCDLRLKFSAHEERLPKRTEWVPEWEAADDAPLSECILSSMGGEKATLIRDQEQANTRHLSVMIRLLLGAVFNGVTHHVLCTVQCIMKSAPVLSSSHFHAMDGLALVVDALLREDAPPTTPKDTPAMRMHSGLSVISQHVRSLQALALDTTWEGGGGVEMMGTRRGGVPPLRERLVSLLLRAVQSEEWEAHEDAIFEYATDVARRLADGGGVLECVTGGARAWRDAVLRSGLCDAARRKRGRCSDVSDTVWQRVYAMCEADNALPPDGGAGRCEAVPSLDEDTKQGRMRARLCAASTPSEDGGVQSVAAVSVLRLRPSSSSGEEGGAEAFCTASSVYALCAASGGDEGAWVNGFLKEGALTSLIDLVACEVWQGETTYRLTRGMRRVHIGARSTAHEAMRAVRTLVAGDRLMKAAPKEGVRTAVIMLHAFAERLLQHSDEVKGEAAYAFQEEAMRVVIEALAYACTYPLPVLSANLLISSTYQ